jgi:hypothetical protein
MGRTSQKTGAAGIITLQYGRCRPVAAGDHDHNCVFRTRHRLSDSTPAEIEAQQKAAEAKAFDERIAQYERNVTLGNWTAVRDFIASQDEEVAKAAYEHLLAAVEREVSLE